MPRLNLPPGFDHIDVVRLHLRQARQLANRYPVPIECVKEEIAYALAALDDKEDDGGENADVL